MIPRANPDKSLPAPNDAPFRLDGMNRNNNNIRRPAPVQYEKPDLSIDKCEHISEIQSLTLKIREMRMKLG